MENCILIYSVLCFFFLIVVIIGTLYLKNRKNLELQELYAQKLLQAHEKEKDLISRKLHDTVGQNILFVRNQLVKDNQLELIAAVDQAILEMRNISRDLYPSQLEKYGLVAAVEALAEKVQENSSVFVSHDLEALDVNLSGNQKINYYRVIEECASNMLKYSGATAFRIAAQKVPNGVTLVIQDNGKGFDKSMLSTEKQHSMGILDLQERIKFLKGKFELETSPGNGTRYTFYIPS